MLSVSVVDSAVASAADNPPGSVPPPDQMAEATFVLTVWVSLRSTSAKSTAPFMASGVVEPVTPAASAIGPFWTLDVIAGASLVPVMVMVTGCVELAPSLSVTVTVGDGQCLAGGEEVKLVSAAL